MEVEVILVVVVVDPSVRAGVVDFVGGGTRPPKLANWLLLLGGAKIDPPRLELGIKGEKVWGCGGGVAGVENASPPRSNKSSMIFFGCSFGAVEVALAAVDFPSLAVTVLLRPEAAPSLRETGAGSPVASGSGVRRELTGSGSPSALGRGVFGSIFLLLLLPPALLKSEREAEARPPLLFAEPDLPGPSSLYPPYDDVVPESGNPEVALDEEP